MDGTLWGGETRLQIGFLCRRIGEPKAVFPIRVLIRLNHGVRRRYRIRLRNLETHKVVPRPRKIDLLRPDVGPDRLARLQLDTVETNIRTKTRLERTALRHDRRRHGIGRHLAVGPHARLAEKVVVPQVVRDARLILERDERRRVTRVRDVAARDGTVVAERRRDKIALRVGRIIVPRNVVAAVKAVHGIRVVAENNRVADKGPILARAHTNGPCRGISVERAVHDSVDEIDDAIPRARIHDNATEHRTRPRRATVSGGSALVRPIAVKDAVDVDTAEPAAAARRRIVLDQAIDNVVRSVDVWGTATPPPRVPMLSSLLFCVAPPVSVKLSSREPDSATPLVLAMATQRTAAGPNPLTALPAGSCAPWMIVVSRHAPCHRPSPCQWRSGS